MTTTKTKITKTTEVSLEDLSEIVLRSKTWLNERAREGFFKSERHGHYRLGNVVAGIVRYYEALVEGARETAQTSPARERLLEVRTRQVEQRIAREKREVLTMADHLMILDVIQAKVRAEWHGLPRRCSRALRAVMPDVDERQVRDVIERECVASTMHFNAALEREAQRVEQLHESGINGTNVVVDDDEEDAE